MKVGRITVGSLGRLAPATLELEPGLNLVLGADAVLRDTARAAIEAVLLGIQPDDPALKEALARGGLDVQAQLATSRGLLTVARKTDWWGHQPVFQATSAGERWTEAAYLDLFAGLSRRALREALFLSAAELEAFDLARTRAPLGDVLLAAARPGAQRVPRALARLRAEMDVPLLAQAEADLERVREELAALTHQLERVSKRAKERERWLLAVNEAKARREQARAEWARLVRLRRVRDDVLRWRALERQVGELPDPSRLPDGVLAKVEGLRAEVKRLRAHRDELLSEMTQVSRQLESVSVRDADLVHDVLGVRLAAYQGWTRHQEGARARARSWDARGGALADEVRSAGLSSELLLSTDKELPGPVAGEAEARAIRVRALAEAREASANRTAALHVAVQLREKLEAEVRRLSSELASLPTLDAAGLRARKQALEGAPAAREAWLGARAQSERLRGSRQRLAAGKERLWREWVPTWVGSLGGAALAAFAVSQLVRGGDLRFALGTAASGALFVLLSSVVGRFRARAWRRRLAHPLGPEQAAQEQERALREAFVTLCQRAEVAEEDVPGHLGDRMLELSMLEVQIVRRERVARAMETIAARLTEVVSDERRMRVEKDVAEAQASALQREIAAGEPVSRAQLLRRRLLAVRGERQAQSRDAELLDAAGRRLQEAVRRIGESAESPKEAAEAAQAYLARMQGAVTITRLLEERRVRIAGDLARCHREWLSREEEVRQLVRHSGCADALELVRLAKQVAQRQDQLWEQRALAARIERRSGRTASQMYDELKRRGRKLEWRLAQARAVARKEALDLRALSTSLAGAPLMPEGEELTEKLAALRNDEHRFMVRASELASARERAQVSWMLVADQAERWALANEARVLERASRIFGRLTAGAFVYVRRLEGEERRYEVQDSELNHLPVDELQPITLRLLFLAFRLAGFELLAEAGEPLPLFIEELVAEFDPELTPLIVRTLSQLGPQLQVVVFSAKPELVTCFHEVDARVVRVLELPTPAGAVAKGPLGPVRRHPPASA